MSKPTGLPDGPIQVNEDAANMELKQQAKSTCDLFWSQEDRLEAHWGADTGNPPPPGETAKLSVLSPEKVPQSQCSRDKRNV